MNWKQESIIEHDEKEKAATALSRLHGELSTMYGILAIPTALMAWAGIGRVSDADIIAYLLSIPLSLVIGWRYHAGRESTYAADAHEHWEASHRLKEGASE